MKRLLILFAIVIATINTFSQHSTDSGYLAKKISAKGIKDCVVSRDIFYLDEDGKLFILSPDNYALKKVISFNSKIVAIAKDTLGDIIFADDKGIVSQLTENFDTVILFNTNQPIQSICIASINDIYLVVDKGIYYPKYERIYYENAFSDMYAYSIAWNPSIVQIDKEDNLWLGFDRGEWGGEIVVFSPWRKKFFSLEEMKTYRCYLDPVRSIFQIDSLMYVTTSLQHMTLLQSSLIALKDSCRSFFSTDQYYATNTIKGEALYIGPATFNKKSNSIYFYCQYGVFKGSLKSDLSNIKNWKKELETTLSWKYGQPASVGYGMNVSKMFFENDKLFIISPGNGLLVWDGKTKVLIK